MWSGDRRLDKPGHPVGDDVALEVRGLDHPWVSRGGSKLAHALSHFVIDPAGQVALDVGASTGGFTDCLLKYGAARVYAVDVGQGQLAWALRNRAMFPVDVNRAPREMLLRVPGLGTKAVKRIIASRVHQRRLLEDVGRVCQSIAAVRPFIVAEGWSPGASLDAERLRETVAPKEEQLRLL